MSKSAFNYLEPETKFTKNASEEYLWQLLQNGNKYTAVINIGYNLQSAPNKAAVKADNKASQNAFPVKANNFCFTIQDESLFDRYATTEPLPSENDRDFQQKLEKVNKRNATKPIVDNFLTGFAKDVAGTQKKLNFAENPKTVNLYPAEKNERYLVKMKTLLGLAGFKTNMTEVQIGGKKPTPAIQVILG